MDSNNTYPLISIIMPVYNSEKYLRRAVQSVLKQTVPDFELLLIDDGSTDGSGVLCDEFAIQDARIHVYHKENGGVCSARNYGIRISSGKYITFIDNDDVYDEQFCEVLIDMLENSNADIAKCGRRNIKISPEQEILTERICTWRKTEVMDKDEFRGQYYELKTSEILSAVWNGIYRRDTLISSGVQFDETLRHGNEDILFNSLFLGHCKIFAITDRVLYTHYYRIGHSTSMKFYPDQITSRIKVLNEEIKLVNSDKIDMVILEGIRECFRLMVPLNRKRERDEYIRIVKSELDFTVFDRVHLLNNPDLSIRAKLDLIMIRAELYWLYFFARRTRVKLQ